MILWQQLCGTFLQSACQLHVPSKLEPSVVVLCDKTARFRVAFYFPNTGARVQRSCCLNSSLMCHNCQVDGLSWQRRNAHKQGCKQICAHLRKIRFFLSVENFWDIQFQLMKHGANNFAFLLLFSIDKVYVHDLSLSIPLFLVLCTFLCHAVCASMRSVCI